MTPLRSYPVLLLLLSALAILSGCARKKPVTVAVPQEQPPIVAPTPTPAPTPQAQTQPQSPQPAAQPSEQQPNQETAGTSTRKTQKEQRRRRRVAVKKPSPVVRADATPPRPDARATPAPISPTVSPRDAQRDQSSTEKLLQSAEYTLNNIKRQLSKQEEAMVAQARSYINQSRQATKDNDPARAFTLAQKANWLSNELVR
ncbi:MAG TPA: hypothetical protein VFP59_01055 [Candidatus Angelobacter sp.]|nr:hypothetical protein [Candidatus Angelobacter sp.]